MKHFIFGLLAITTMHSALAATTLSCRTPKEDGNLITIQKDGGEETVEVTLKDREKETFLVMTLEKSTIIAAKDPIAQENGAIRDAVLMNLDEKGIFGTIAYDGNVLFLECGGFKSL